MACLIQLSWRLNHWGQWWLIVFHWWSWSPIAWRASQKKIKSKTFQLVWIKCCSEVVQKVEEEEEEVSLLFWEVLTVHNHFSYSIRLLHSQTINNSSALNKENHASAWRNNSNTRSCHKVHLQNNDHFLVLKRFLLLSLNENLLLLNLLLHFFHLVPYTWEF